MECAGILLRTVLSAKNAAIETGIGIEKGEDFPECDIPRRSPQFIPSVDAPDGAEEAVASELTENFLEVDRRYLLVTGDFLERTGGTTRSVGQVAEGSDAISCCFRDDHCGKFLPSYLDVC
jgi:hypothetical protein